MVSTTTERVSKVEAKRMWIAMVTDSHNIFPKVLPEIFSSAAILEGDGGVGTIKQFKFNSGEKEFRSVKERVNEIDSENMVYKYSVIEGAGLGILLSSFSTEVKITPSEDGGCVVARTSNFEIIAGAQFDEGKAREMKETMYTMFNKVEQYLLSNPNLYC